MLKDKYHSGVRVLCDADSGQGWLCSRVLFEPALALAGNGRIAGYQP